MLRSRGFLHGRGLVVHPARGYLFQGGEPLALDGVESPEASARRLERSLVVDASVLIEQEPAGSPRRDTR